MNLFTMDIPKRLWLSANGTQPHWAAKGEIVAELRHRAAQEAARQGVQARTTKTLLFVQVGYPTRRRADPPNANPTVKPIIDGLVDAGIFPDDNSDWVAVAYDRDPVKSLKDHYRLTFHMTDFAEQTLLGTN